MKILIVDDDPIVCQSLKMIIEIQSKEAHRAIEVVEICHNGKEAIELYRSHRPHIVLMDIRMELMDGIEASCQILKMDKEAKILFLTTFLDDEYIIQALRLGACGYLMKSNVESIVPALFAIEKGQHVYGDEIVEKIPRFLSQSPRDKRNLTIQQWGLSPRELDIIELVAQGLNNKEIAENLYLSPGTVRNYLSQILEKLSLRDRTQLAVYYYKNIGQK